MNDNRELNKTIGFAVVAIVFAGLSAIAGWASRPPVPAEFSDIGEPFYADFTDASQATRLRLASWNDELAKTDVFEVKFTPESGWTIPSYNDYPADGEEQLSKTAASVIGIKRGGLMPGRADSHSRYGVIDPLDESATGTEGRGSRLTLWDGDNVVADYIIGKPVSDEDDDTTSSGEALYYVRKAGEDGEERVYRAALDIDISTDFSDWIEPDLLQLGTVSDLRRIEIDRYQVDEQTGRVTEGDKSLITRASATDNWALDGLDESKESLVTGTVSKIVTALDDLEIIGVRKKPAILSAQLKREEVSGVSNFDIIRMQNDLQSKGFFLDQSGALVSNEGDFTAGIDEGIVYTLRFGEVFSGSRASLEVGGTEETANDDAAADADEAASESDPASEDSEDSSDTLKGRYVFITVAFDESLLTPVGEAPQKPEPPPTSDESPAAEKADSPDADDAPTSDQTAEDKSAEYEAAVEAYEFEVEEFERKKKAYDEKIEAGKKRVEELSRRFADWYYVIDAETFDDLAVDRSDLVEPKEEPEVSSDPAEAPGLPPLGDLPKVEPKPMTGGDETPAEEAPQDPKSEKVEPVMQSVKGAESTGADPAPPENPAKADEKVEPVMESVKGAEDPAPKPTDEKPADQDPGTGQPESSEATEPAAESVPESSAPSAD